MAPAVTAERITNAAIALRQTHPHAPAIEILDLLLYGEAAGSVAALSGLALHPRSPLGQLVAEAFDRGMSPDEWLQLTGPQADPRMVDALEEIWRTEVLQRFAARYGRGGI